MDWLETTLGNVAPFTYGKRLPASQRKGGIVAVYGSNGCVGTHDEALTQGPTIVIGRKGSVGAIHISDAPCWPIDTSFYVSESSTTDLYFIYYLLQTLPLQESSDSAVPGLNREYAHSLRVSVPSLEEQRAISGLLRTLDEKIRINTEISKTLEEIAQTIFKSWFVDFDPVHAKARGGQPEGMDNATAALFPDSFEESELGLIPKGWKVKSLDEVAEYLNGLALQKYPAVSGEASLPVIKISQLRAGNTTGSDLSSAGIASKYQITDGDILFSWSGTLEVEWWMGGAGALNQHLFKVTGTQVPNWFAYFATKHHLDDFRAIASSKATTMGHIQRGHLTAAKISQPPQALIANLGVTISELVQLKLTQLQEVKVLAEIRDALLPRLISGELEIPEEMLSA